MDLSKDTQVEISADHIMQLSENESHQSVEASALCRAKTPAQRAMFFPELLEAILLSLIPDSLAKVPGGSRYYTDDGTGACDQAKRSLDLKPWSEALSNIASIQSALFLSTNTRASSLQSYTTWSYFDDPPALDSQVDIHPLLEGICIDVTMCKVAFPDDGVPCVSFLNDEPIYGSGRKELGVAGIAWILEFEVEHFLSMKPERFRTLFVSRPVLYHFWIGTEFGPTGTWEFMRCKVESGVDFVTMAKVVKLHRDKTDADDAMVMLWKAQGEM